MPLRQYESGDHEIAASMHGQREVSTRAWITKALTPETRDQPWKKHFTIVQDPTFDQGQDILDFAKCRHVNAQEALLLQSSSAVRNAQNGTR